MNKTGFAATPVLAAVLLACAAGAGAGASTHREAPFTATSPKVDGTDFYMFPQRRNRPQRLRHPDCQ